MNPFSIIAYQLYLLQLENYELGRYWNLLELRGFFPQGQLRTSLVWTKKATSLLVIAVLLHVLFGFFLVSWMVEIGPYAWIIALCIFLLLVFCYFLFFTIATWILWPFDAAAKWLVVRKAKQKIQRLRNLKIIGIAGSYGKTTMKEVLKQVISSKASPVEDFGINREELAEGFKVVSTPESVNTLVGVARWILSSVNESTRVIIVEMGEHYRGDIAKLCQLTRPDVAVVTGINEAHLERMKKLGNIVRTVFEIVEEAKGGALVVLNGDDERVKSQAQKFIQMGQTVAWYGVRGESLKVTEQRFDADQLGWEIEVEELGKIFVPLLGEYGIGDLLAAVQIARHLGVSDGDIKQGILNIKPIEHRLQPIRSGQNVLVIDDSYNGNPDGVREAVEVLGRFAGRRKLFITPGLVETGKKTAEIHREIGRQLAKVADVVILIRNSVTPFIEEGVRQVQEPTLSGAKQSRMGERFKVQESANPEVIWFDTAQEAHAALPKILKPKDVILFQNDWGDQYI